jgi:hypothetical protein
MELSLRRTERHELAGLLDLDPFYQHLGGR